MVDRKKCAKDSWGQVCNDPLYKAPVFMIGGFTWVSIPLLNHVFLDSDMATRRSVFFPNGEDMSLANMVYSDPNITVTTYDYTDTNVAAHLIKNARGIHFRYWRYCNLDREAAEEYYKLHYNV